MSRIPGASRKDLTVPADRRARTGVCIVGSGTRFLSGISVYTIRLANALAVSRPVSVVTMRQLLPTRFYPGHDRVGAALTDIGRHPRVTVLDGVDWYWIPSIFRAFAFLLRHRPAVIVMQWWTGTVLHTYVVLALVARLLGTRVIIEFHEILDTGEARIPLVRAYVGVLAPLLFRLAVAYTVHSQFDRSLLRSRYRLGRRPVIVVPHGPHDHYQNSKVAELLPASREAPEEACNLLFFGVIRPYKGLEDLITAFDAIPAEEIGGYWLTVVGETWEGWIMPTTLIEQSRYRERITFVNRYVHDRELDAFLRGSDAVVLPYHRSSLSGPLHVAMGYGLPIVISDVGGNAEAADGYGGIILTEPSQPAALRDALAQVARLRGQRFQHPTDWRQTTGAYEELFERLGVAKVPLGGGQ
jgi:glycosyltransferase involved in cell wall biosynthesis